MKRGDCMFAQKVKHAENAGAIAAIIVDNVKDSRCVLISRLYENTKMCQNSKIQESNLKFQLDQSSAFFYGR